MSNTGERVSRIYSGFRGVDFRGEEINLIRSPDSLNVWKDYKETESIRTRPGLKLVEQFTNPILGIFFHKHRDTSFWIIGEETRSRASGKENYDYVSNCEGRWFLAKVMQ